MDLFDYGADGIWGFRDAEFTGYAARLVGALEHVNPVRASKTSKGYSLDVVIDGNPIRIMILNSTMPNGDQVWYVNKQLLSNSFVTDEEGDFCTVIISSENSDRIVEDILAHLYPDRPMDIDDRLDEARHVLHRRLIGFSFANFKAFGNRQHIPIRPITLVFGPNSGGKSSIIQGMVFAHEAVRTGNANIFATKLGGRAIDLGGFRQYIHKRQIERTCELTISLKSDSIKHDLSYSSFSDAFDTISLTVSIGMPLDFNGNTLPNGAPNVTSLTVEGDGRFLFRMKGFQANGEFLIDKIDLEQEPFYTEVLHTYVLDKDQTIEMIIQTLTEMISHNKVLVRDFLPVGVEKKLYFPNGAKTNSEKTLNTKMARTGDHPDLFDDKMKERYSDLIGVLDSLIYWINSDVREQVEMATEK